MREFMMYSVAELYMLCSIDTTWFNRCTPVGSAVLQKRLLSCPRIVVTSPSSSMQNVRNTVQSINLCERRHIPVRACDEEMVPCWTLVSAEAPMDTSAVIVMTQRKSARQSGLIIFRLHYLSAKGSSAELGMTIVQLLMCTRTELICFVSSLQSLQQANMLQYDRSPGLNWIFWSWIELKKNQEKFW